MDKVFRVFALHHYDKEKLDIATKCEDITHEIANDFFRCCESVVVEWVAEQCKSIMKEMDK